MYLSSAARTIVRHKRKGPRRTASRFLEQFRERLAKFGLELHAEKTRLIEFGSFAEQNRKRRGEGKPETFTFMGCKRMAQNGQQADGGEAAILKSSIDPPEA